MPRIKTKHVIITFGVCASGKSRYADLWIKEHPEYVLIETVPDIEKMIERIGSVEYAILDYYFALDWNANALRSALKCDVDVLVLFDKPETLSRRQIDYKPMCETNRVDCWNKRHLYFEALDTLIDINECTYLDGEHKKYTQKEFVLKQIEYWEPYTADAVLDFLRRIETIEGYDKHYHHIDLPHGFRIGRDGYARNEETWSIISDWVDWNDKAVIDFCCFHGYFCQQISKCGGRASGYEMHNEAVYSAAIFSKMNDAPFALYHADIEGIRFKDINADIALLLNVFHHLKDKIGILQKLSKYKIVIFEINKTNRGLVCDYFTVIREAVSPKDNRVILMCEPKQ